jgi:hypothetical protein
VLLPEYLNALLLARLANRVLFNTNQYLLILASDCTREKSREKVH